MLETGLVVNFERNESFRISFLKGDKISMWLCETKPQESVVKIGQTLKRRLGIDDKVTINLGDLLLFMIQTSHFRQKAGSSWI